MRARGGADGPTPGTRGVPAAAPGPKTSVLVLPLAAKGGVSADAAELVLAALGGEEDGGEAAFARGIDVGAGGDELFGDGGAAFSDGPHEGRLLIAVFGDVGFGAVGEQEQIVGHLKVMRARVRAGREEAGPDPVWGPAPPPIQCGNNPTCRCWRMYLVKVILGPRLKNGPPGTPREGGRGDLHKASTPLCFCHPPECFGPVFDVFGPAVVRRPCFCLKHHFLFNNSGQ